MFYQIHTKRALIKRQARRCVNYYTLAQSKTIRMAFDAKGNLQASPPTYKALLTRLSSKAPRSAVIVRRDTARRNIPTYTIRVGGVEINNVSMDEIFDFVSPQDYEAFEHASLSKESQEEDRHEQMKSTKKRGPGRPRKVAAASEPSASSGSSAGGDDVQTTIIRSTNQAMVAIPVAAPTVTQGRHGRPRTSYSHLYLKQPARQEHVYDLYNGGHVVPEEVIPADPTDLTNAADSLSLNERQKRRKISHESDPTSAASDSGSSGSVQVPKTFGDLRARGLIRKTAAIASPASSRKRSLSESSEGSNIDMNPARVAETSAAASARSRSTDSSQAPKTKVSARKTLSPKRSASSTSSMVSQSTQLVQSFTKGTARQIPIKASNHRSSPRAQASQAAGKAQAQPSPARVPAQQSTAKAEPRPSIAKPPARQSKGKAPERSAGLVPPGAASSSATTASAATDSDESESEAEDSYEIEDILAHHLSDPRTHPAEFGKDPIMLFQVKWVGYDELTWEPEESFDDKNVVEQYWRRVEADVEDGDFGDDVQMED